MDFTVKGGEHRARPTESVRVYFWGILPTGITVALNKYSKVKQLFFRMPKNDQLHGEREIQASYTCNPSSNVRIQMSIMHTVTGRPRSTIAIPIELDDDAAELVIKGPYGFGEFKGRGKLLIPRESIPSTVEISEAECAITTDKAKDLSIIWEE